MATGISALSGNTAATASPATANKNDVDNDPAAAQDRFLKLLVAQMNNQDPMNPLDNAQMTSQIAQINTVTGIQRAGVNGGHEHGVSPEITGRSAVS